MNVNHCSGLLACSDRRIFEQPTEALSILAGGEAAPALGKSPALCNLALVQVLYQTAHCQ